LPFEVFIMSAVFLPLHATQCTRGASSMYTSALTRQMTSDVARSRCDLMSTTYSMSQMTALLH